MHRYYMMVFLVCQGEYSKIHNKKQMIRICFLLWICVDFRCTGISVRSKKGESRDIPQYAERKQE